MLEVDPRSLNSLESLKSWISRKSSIPVARQILMTGKGKPVKLQNLLTEKEIFVYDREFLSPRPPGQDSQRTARPIPSPYLPQQAPDVLSDQTSLDAWQLLFRERQSWAIQIAKTSDAMIQQIHVYSKESDIIRRATLIAAANPKQHVQSIQQKYEDAERWIESVIEDQSKLVAQADGNLVASRSITTFNALTRAISGASVGTLSGKGFLNSLFDTTAIDAAKKRTAKTMITLRRRLEDVQSLYDDVIHDTEDLSKQIESRLSPLSGNASETIHALVEEMDVCVRQIKADCENAMRANKDPRSVAAVSKTALLHTKKFLPSLYDTAIDIGDLLRRSAERRNSIEDMALHFLQRTAAIESTLASVQSQMRNIDLEAEDDAAMETLSRAVQYPSIYASVLVEIVRRQEWNQKMLTDTSTLAEEMAGFTDEEEKRRKKWLKSLDGFVISDSFGQRVRSIEISVSGQEQNWPSLIRNDIDNLIHELQSVGGMEDVIQEIMVWLKDLDTPSRNQPKKSNTFRNGALSESTFGKNSLLLRGNDELVNTLQNDKNKLEDRLKGSESRIRKLEDLLHRSNSMARPFTGGSGAPNGHSQAPSMERNRSSSGVGYAASPRLNDSASRRSSVASHRLSINQAQEDDPMLHRVLQLEAELATERKRIAQFEQSIFKQSEVEDELRRQIEDASLMKKDLMDNFQAKQQEFDGERKLLEDEIKKTKIRHEEMEEEYERVLGSHDNTRGAYSDLVKEHEQAVESLRENASKDLQKANDRIGNLQTVNDNQRDHLNMLEEEASRNANLIATLRQDIEQHRSTQEDLHQILHRAHTELDPESDIPNDFSELVRNLETVSQRARSQNKDLRLITDAMKEQNDSLENRFKAKETEFYNLRNAMDQKNQELSEIREHSSAHEARAHVLGQELSKERETLKAVRAQIPGSEAIKVELAQAEKRAEDLSLQLATIQASNNQSNAEVLEHLKAINVLQTSNDISNTRLADRAQRAAEVSLLLYLQTDRLTRLLEHIGYSVSREDNTMVLQRIGRTISGNNPPGEANQALTRSMSASVPQLGDDTPPEYLHWATAFDIDIEKQFFEDFIHESKAFNLDAFCEAVVKRIKDTEHIARKWQREARTYRDRYRGSQFEAQHKIAYRAFKEGDLALFLPTRSQAPQRSWAAFNVGAPHYFLREQDKHRLTSRDWLLARITTVEERLVDLSKSMNSRLAAGISEDGNSLEDDNPFGLSDGLRWYYLDAEEERLGAPIAPGPARATVASAQIDAEGSIQRKKTQDQGIAARVLTKSLDSRRSSANSRKSLIGVIGSPPIATPADHGHGSDGTSAIVDDGFLRPNAATAGPSKSTHQEEGPATSTPNSPIRQSQSKQQSPSKKPWESLFSLDVALDRSKRN